MTYINISFHHQSMGFESVFFGLWLGHGTDFDALTPDRPEKGAKSLNIEDFFNLVADKVYFNTEGIRDVPMSDCQTCPVFCLERGNFSEVWKHIPKEDDIEHLDENCEKLIFEIHLLDDVVSYKEKRNFKEKRTEIIRKNCITVSFTELANDDLYFEFVDADMVMGSLGCCCYGIGYGCANSNQQIEITPEQLQKIIGIYDKLAAEIRLPSWAYIGMRSNCCS